GCGPLQSVCAPMSPGAHTASKRRQAGGKAAVQGSARGSAAWRVASTSKTSASLALAIPQTTHLLHRPVVCECLRLGTGYERLRDRGYLPLRDKRLKLERCWPMRLP